MGRPGRARSTPVSISVAEGARVLFSPGGTQQYSTPMCLKAGERAYISAFGLPCGEELSVWRMILRPGEMPATAPCDPCPSTGLPSPSPAQVAFAKPLVLCGQRLVIADCDSDVVLEGPGCYQLRASSLMAVTDLYVEAMVDDSRSERSSR